MPLYEGYLLYTTYRASVYDVRNEVWERRGQKMHQICGQTRTKRGKGENPKILWKLPCRISRCRHTHFSRVCRACLKFVNYEERYCQGKDIKLAEICASQTMKREPANMIRSGAMYDAAFEGMNTTSLTTGRRQTDRSEGGRNPDLGSFRPSRAIMLPGMRSVMTFTYKTLLTFEVVVFFSTNKLAVKT